MCIRDSYCVFNKLKKLRESFSSDADRARIDALYDYWRENDLKTKYCNEALIDDVIGRFIDCETPLIATARLSGMMLNYPLLLENGIEMCIRDRTKSVEENLEKYVKVWTPIVRHAEEMGVRIGIENCPMYYTKDEWPGGNNLASTPYIWKKMFELIPSKNLGLNFDPSHP